MLTRSRKRPRCNRLLYLLFHPLGLSGETRAEKRFKFVNVAALRVILFSLKHPSNCRQPPSSCTLELSFLCYLLTGCNQAWKRVRVKSYHTAGLSFALDGCNSLTHQNGSCFSCVSISLLRASSSMVYILVLLAQLKRGLDSPG